MRVRFFGIGSSPDRSLLEISLTDSSVALRSCAAGASNIDPSTIALVFDE
jgi:hypothetical protein